MKKTVRFHRGDSPFKMKENGASKGGGGDEKTGSTSSTETKKAVDSSGNLVNATTTKTHVQAAKKSAQNKSIGTNVANIKKKGIKSKSLENYGLKHPAERAKANAALAEAKKKDEASIDSDSSSSKDVEETKNKNIPTPGVKGTSNDVFTAKEKRDQIRNEKLSNRGERQEGKQELRKDKQYMKHTKEWGSMTGSERSSAKKELKQGGGDTIKSKFGEDLNKDVETSHKKRWGQGELNKARVKEAEETPGQRVAAEKAQFVEAKNAGGRGGKRLSTETNYKEGNVKKVEASPTTKASEEDKSKLPISIEGSKETSASSETSKENATEKPKSIFAKMLNNFDAKKTTSTKAEPAATTNNKEQSDATSQLQKRGTTTPEVPAQKKDDTTDVKSVANMTRKASGFSMKGFGAKAGFNFNSKK